MSHCHISWDSYRNNIYKGFSRLQQNEQFVDMTVAADGYLVNVHKTMMALASPYIGEMLQSAPCQHPVIFLNNVSHDVLAFILDYIYTGEAYVPKEKISLFITTAKALQITGIKDIITPMCYPFVDIKTQVIEKSKIMERKRKIMSSTQSSAGRKLNFLEGNAKAQETPTNLNQNNAGSTDNVFNTSPDIDFGTEDTQNGTNNLVSKEVEIYNSDTQHFPIHFEEQGTEKARTCVPETGAELLTEPLSSQHLVTNNYSSAMSEEFIFKPPLNIGIDEKTLDAPVKHIMIQELNDKNLCQESSHTDPPNEHIYHQWKVNPVATHNYMLEVQPTNTQSSQLTSNIETKDINNLLASKATSPLYMVSIRGSLQLILNRYLYNKHHSANGGLKIRWRCIDYRLKHCQAFVDTDGELITSRKHTHCHPFHDRQILKKGQKNKVFSTQHEAEAAAKNKDNVFIGQNETVTATKTYTENFV